MTVALGGISKWYAGALAGAAIAVTATAGYAADLSLKDGGYKDGPLTGDKLEWTANIAGTSDYIFRGISQNRREPTVQGGVDLTYGLFYAGVWASGVNFDAAGVSPRLNSHTEIDVYGGIKPKYGDVTFDFGVIAYNYPNTDINHGAYLYDPAYVEFKLGASKTVWNDVALGGTIFISPDYAGEAGTTLTFEGTVSKPVYKYGDVDFATSATIGYVDFTDKSGAAIAYEFDSYAYYNVGLTATYKAFSLDFRWWDTSLSDTSLQCNYNTVGQCGSAFVATGKVSF
jgi:uncharacterized protein (TIGR02001 family)